MGGGPKAKAGGGHRQYRDQRGAFLRHVLRRLGRLALEVERLQHAKQVYRRLQARNRCSDDLRRRLEAADLGVGLPRTPYRTSRVESKVHDAAVARMFEAAQSEDGGPTDFTTEAHHVSRPKIIFSTGPAVLVMVEGDPILRDVTGTTLKRVVNTKALILRDEADAYCMGA